MLNSTTRFFEGSSAVSRLRRQTGYTLLEILISITLMLMLMYGVAAIFSRVGGIMNETQSTMEMTNNLRNTRARLESDLKMVSVPLVPPRNSNANEGYFCYIEGLGVSYRNSLYLNNYKNIVIEPGVTQDIYVPGTSAVALDSDRGTNAVDSTAGDSDDILMFTAQAPAGKYFRGRVGDEIMESEFAEIVWFLRGTTLYRRVLLILPNEVLQSKLNSVDYRKVGGVSLSDSIPNSQMPRISEEVKQGYGFFRFYDVSVHLNNNNPRYIVANTLADLSNRANRYGFWRTMNPYYSNSGITYDGFMFKRTSNESYDDGHGYFDSWYWLRLPTLQESATYLSNQTDLYKSFKAGEPFGQYNSGNNNLVFPGWYQALTSNSDNSNCVALPKSVADPFIDYWIDPNCWSEVNPESGDLSSARPDDSYPIFTQDVILTNVLAFDVKAWDDTTNRYVDLGFIPNTSGFLSRGSYSEFGEFGSSNAYLNAGVHSNEANIDRKPFLPCVFDTWTEQYELEYLRRKGGQSNSGLTASDIPLEGKLSVEDIPDFPPPYSTPLKALQVELRVFDPRSGNIKNMTLNVDYSTKSK